MSFHNRRGAIEAVAGKATELAGRAGLEKLLHQSAPEGFLNCLVGGLRQQDGAPSRRAVEGFGFRVCKRTGDTTRTGTTSMPITTKRVMSSGSVVVNNK